MKLVWYIYIYIKCYTNICTGHKWPLWFVSCGWIHANPLCPGDSKSCFVGVRRCQIETFSIFSSLDILITVILYSLSKYLTSDEVKKLLLLFPVNIMPNLTFSSHFRFPKPLVSLSSLCKCFLQHISFSLSSGFLSHLSFCFLFC